MAPYKDCISKGVCTVMASYSSWNGSKLHSNRFLLTDILKEKWGFKGIVISDWEGIDRLSNPRGSNYRNAISSAINAGIDMVVRVNFIIANPNLWCFFFSDFTNSEFAGT